METLFNVKEETPKKGSKTERLLVMPTIKLTRPNPRANTREKEPWEYTEQSFPVLQDLETPLE